MLKMELELRFLTPAFTGGADPRLQTEFAPKALKSAMRHWWRETQDWSDTRRLFAREEELFGHTERASPFFIHSLASHHLQIDCDSNGYLSNNPQAGRSYLFFSCRKQGKSAGRTSWISPKSRVTVGLTFLRSEPDIVDPVLYSLWLAQSFGGLGARSRRGAGSFALDLVGCPAAFDYLQQLFAVEAREFIEHWLKPSPSPTGSLPARFFPLINTASPLSGAWNAADHFKRTQSRATAEEVLDVIGEKMRSYRAVYGAGGTAFQVDARALHAYAVSEAKVTYRGRDPLPKHAFGLPVQYNFRRRAGKGFENQYIEASPQSHDRRASPLRISIKQEVSGQRRQYYANLLILWHHFLPARERISLSVRQRRHTGTPVKTHLTDPPRDPQAIIDFMRTVP